MPSQSQDVEELLPQRGVSTDEVTDTENLKKDGKAVHAESAALMSTTDTSSRAATATAESQQDNAVATTGTNSQQNDTSLPASADSDASDDDKESSSTRTQIESDILQADIVKDVKDPTDPCWLVGSKSLSTSHM